MKSFGQRPRPGFGGILGAGLAPCEEVCVSVCRAWSLLKGTWDLVIGAISKVTTVIITYNPN